jgi:hypothetical protein
MICHGRQEAWSLEEKLSKAFKEKCNEETQTKKNPVAKALGSPIFRKRIVVE